MKESRLHEAHFHLLLRPSRLCFVMLAAAFTAALAQTDAPILFNTAFEGASLGRIEKLGHTQFRLLGQPVANLSSPSFGSILGTANDPRVIEFGLKFVY
ncbi:MAG: hypothetical protein GEU99_02610 [Luteitalea sp.]|nr:hypothetical protein [Luteitalea sp.]